MQPDPAHILDQALRLAPTVRASIAEALLDSLDSGDDFPLSPEWLDEVRRRCAAIDAGTARLIDHTDALRELRENRA